MTESFEALIGYVGAQLQGSKKGSKLAQNGDRHPFVTISRQAGAGGITIGAQVAAYLQEHDKGAACPWTVFDRNLIEVILEEHHLPKKYAESMPEKRTSELRHMVEEVFKLHPTQWTLVHKASETILHLAELGYSIIVGRGGNIITRRLATGFHVRLVGSLEKRAKRVESYYKLTHDQALKFAKKEDKNRKSYVKEHFGQNIDNPLIYDVVINTDSISVEAAARLIGDSVLEIRVR